MVDGYHVQEGRHHMEIGSKNSLRAPGSPSSGLSQAPGATLNLPIEATPEVPGPKPKVVGPQHSEAQASLTSLDG